MGRFDLKPNLCLRKIFPIFLIVSAGLQSLEAEEANQVKWTETGSLLTARVNHTATLLPNGEVLIVGGHGPTDDLASAELYKPKEGVFVSTGDLNSGRTNHTATLLPNGKVLVVGGQSNGSTLASAELYDPSTGKWTVTGSLNFPRSYHTATLLPNGQVLVVGGSYVASPPVFSQGAPAGSAMDIAELYDPTTGKWTVTGNLFAARYVHTATLLKNGQVLVTGGLGSEGGGSALACSELYDPKTRTWTGTGNPQDMRYWHVATLLSDGQVLVVGGQFNESKLASAELYNVSSGTWTATGSLHEEQSGLTATLLPNGHVLVAGGSTQSGILSTAELYDPFTGKWETTVSLNTPRLLHTATLLPNGLVLVTGGSDGSGDPGGVLASAELYHSGIKPRHKSTLQQSSD